MTLVEFLTARLDEDEAAAKLVESAWPGITLAHAADDAEHYAFHANDLSPTRVAHIMRHNPARVLREVTAKRALVVDCSIGLSGEGEPSGPAGKYAHYLANRQLRTLAAVYSDHPDYKQAVSETGQAG